jgi:hypothetical protein
MYRQIHKHLTFIKLKFARLKNWDYGSNAAYDVTICNNKMVCFFWGCGELCNGIIENLTDCVLMLVGNP